MKTQDATNGPSTAKKAPTLTWSPKHSEEYYGFNRWGGGHFVVGDDGTVAVDPCADGRTIRIMDVIQEATGMGLKAPMVIRFQDLLRQRVTRLNEVFRTAIKDEGYKGDYRGVYPIKVNQLREVVEEIMEAGKPFNYGLEAGSKPELMIALALHDNPKALIICNGYKDDDYIRLALLGRKLGKRIILVVEQLSEVESIIRLSKEMNVKPLVGFRAKLATKGEGKWAMSTGDNAKFGLTTSEILAAADMLEAAKLRKSLVLVHFHIGSQVPNILTIRTAVIEATRFYCELAKLGFAMGLLDVGGGLGLDYDGSRTNYESSMNYSPEEYARDVVHSIKEVCDNAGVPVPDIVSESGRAVTGAHSMLVIEVFDRISKSDVAPSARKLKTKHKIIQDLEDLLKARKTLGRLERFHRALQKKDEAANLFNLGFLDLANRAFAESTFWKICAQIDKEGTDAGYQPEELFDLKRILADQYICNFSVFQSLIDHWALGQLFPIAPVHRLEEKPTVDAILVDITCDSDGKISKFVDLEDVKETITLHPLNGKPYYLGIFLTGAYQDIMGDIHNLFGRVSEVHVFLEPDEPNGFYVEETIRGTRVGQVMEDVQYDSETLCLLMKRQIDQATRRDAVKPREGVRLLEHYEKLVRNETYLNIERSVKARKRR